MDLSRLPTPSWALATRALLCAVAQVGALLPGAAALEAPLATLADLLPGTTLLRSTAHAVARGGEVMVVTGAHLAVRIHHLLQRLPLVSSLLALTSLAGQSYQLVAVSLSADGQLVAHLSHLSQLATLPTVSLPACVCAPTVPGVLTSSLWLTLPFGVFCLTSLALLLLLLAITLLATVIALLVAAVLMLVVMALMWYSTAAGPALSLRRVDLVAPKWCRR
eukprot:EG_transcript_15793